VPPLIWQAWREVLEKAWHMRAHTALVWRSNLLSKVYRRWCEMIVEAEELRGRVKRTVARWLHRLLAVTFNGWRSFMDMQCDVRATHAASALGKWASTLSSRAFAAWVKFTLKGREVQVIRPILGNVTRPMRKLLIVIAHHDCAGGRSDLQPHRRWI
jgi:hypothetical protein